MPTKSPDIEVVVAALARVVRRGLPVTASAAEPALLDLRGVLARSVDPEEESSRVAALDGLLHGLLARFPDARYAQAARALFGLPPAQPGQTLTVRRKLAAAAAAHEMHHFRKRVEPRLIRGLASAILADADRFTRSRLIAPRLAPASERQLVPADPFAWEVVDHEEALCRVWATIYALRAELLSIERLISLGADRQQVICQAVTAAWRWCLASAEVTGYVAAFDADNPTGGVSPRELLAGAGWTPPLTPEQESRLRGAAASGADRDRFAAALHADTELARAWIDAFLDSVKARSSHHDRERQVS